ncbi:MAG: DUF488 domain-containing protein [Rhodospirillaceae bacterium]|nr:DUF488 domain-containing protein [Rhodospirillaceae bacterium]
MIREINLFTIGFTKTTAENFFNRLVTADVSRVIDVRLNITSQLSGFAKGRDIAYFLKAIGEIDYLHEPLLAPTDDILTAFKKNKGEWSAYETQFLDLMDKRKIDEKLSPDLFERGCLLCSEDKPHQCHRRLVAEFLNDRWNMDIRVKHL